MKCFLNLLAVLSLVGCSSNPEPVEAWLVTPAAGDVVSETTTLRIGYSGPVQSFQILVNEQSVVEADESAGVDGVADLEWDTRGTEDGEVSLVVRVEGDGSEFESEPISLFVDNTPPSASLDIDRLSVLQGDATVPVTIDEPNMISARLLSGDVELASISEPAGEIAWDTTSVQSMVHWIRLVVEDVAGRTAETDEIPVIVANNGLHLSYDDREYTYSPGPQVSATDHTRVAASMGIPDSEPDNIVRLISWMTWDSSSEWTVDFSVGQGLCPHRGVMYLNEISDTGEIILDLAWVDLPPDIQRQSLALDRDHPEDATTFPYNGDPATCGAFFAHIGAVAAPSDVLDIEVNFVFIFGE